MVKGGDLQGLPHHRPCAAVPTVVLGRGPQRGLLPRSWPVFTSEGQGGQPGAARVPGAHTWVGDTAVLLPGQQGCHGLAELPACAHWSWEAETSASGGLSPGWVARREGSDKHFKVPQLTGSLGAKSELFRFSLICDDSVLQDPGASLRRPAWAAKLLRRAL